MSGQWDVRLVAEGRCEASVDGQLRGVLQWNKAEETLDLRTTAPGQYLPILEMFKRISFPEKMLIEIITSQVAVSELLDEARVPDQVNERYLSVYSRVKRFLIPGWIKTSSQGSLLSKFVGEAPVCDCGTNAELGPDHRPSCPLWKESWS